MADFETAHKILHAFEGGYVNDPADSGGETYRGISRRYYSDWPGWKMIDAAKARPGFPGNLSADRSLDQAVLDFYKAEYWSAIRGDEYPDQDIANEVYEAAVNISKRSAVMNLQRALNLANVDQKYYPDMIPDGVIGDKTIAALKAYHSIYSNPASKHPPAYLLNLLNIMQGAHYIASMERTGKNEKFRGWFERVIIRRG